MGVVRVDGGRKSRGGREAGTAASPPARPGGTWAFKVVGLVVALLGFAMLAFVSGAYRPPLAFLAGAYQGISQQQRPELDDAVLGDQGPSADAPRYKYLGGLLAAGFDERSCLSRYQSTIYRKPSPHKPSAYLVERLRKYEENHRRCAPHTAPYNSTLQFLNSGNAPEKETECKYVVWSPWAGLGNRILTIASTFLYALLTDRVLLIDGEEDTTSLFCEPFLGTTWLVPPDFPITDFGAFSRSHPRNYGSLVKSNKISYDDASGTPPPSVVYIHLVDDYSTEEMYFFCERDQAILRRVPWLLLKSSLYFVPGFFLNREFEPELARMFPEKDTVFHHLSRYLFHPTNKVWGMITRYYLAYFATARERLGIQIRVFSSWDAPFKVVSEQITNCTLKEKLLPEVDGKARSTDSTPADPKKTTAVLITSLNSGYADKIREMYSWEHPAAGGAVVSVHQPTHEEKQQSRKLNHNEKAWAEMYLLSLADVLVTSAWSTFGYVAQGLAGKTPWVLVRLEKGVMPAPSCVRDISMEPCLHRPMWYVCREKKVGDNAGLIPFVTHCVDVNGGLKLVDRT